MTQHIKAVLFDLDDTLFDRNKAVEKTLVSTAREFTHLFSGPNPSKIQKVFIASDDIAMLEYKARDCLKGRELLLHPISKSSR